MFQSLFICIGAGVARRAWKPISDYIDFVRSPEPDSKPNNKIVKLNAITIGTIIAPQAIPACIALPWREGGIS